MDHENNIGLNSTFPYKKSQDTTAMQLKPAQKPLSAISIAQLLLYYKLLEI